MGTKRLWDIKCWLRNGDRVPDIAGESVNDHHVLGAVLPKQSIFRTLIYISKCTLANQTVNYKAQTRTTPNMNP